MADEYNNQFTPNEQNVQYNQPAPVPPTKEKVSVGLGILSYLIPIVGLILFLTKKEKRPKTAKVCGICALVSFIINIVLTIVLYAIMGATMFGALSDDIDDEDNISYSDSVEADEGTIVDDNTLGDYKCVVKGAEKCKDYEGKSAVLITYEFTNNSSDAISFDIALDAKAYQDGVGLETAILEDDTDIIDVDIKPGVTKEVKKAYLIRDDTTEIEIEVSEFISFSDEKIVTTVTL